MGQRLTLLALIAAALVGCGATGESNDPVNPPPAQSEAERMQERGYTAEESETKASQPK